MQAALKEDELALEQTEANAKEEEMLYSIMLSGNVLKCSY
jgi:hypothetical protein